MSSSSFRCDGRRITTATGNKLTFAAVAAVVTALFVVVETVADQVAYVDRGSAVTQGIEGIPDRRLSCGELNKGKRDGDRLPPLSREIIYKTSCSGIGAITFTRE